MIPFLKMHGCGNDFVVLDGRAGHLPALNWSLLADRHFGIGCDQVVVLQPSAPADVRMRIFNHDGSESAACGNASRCVGWLISQEPGHTKPTVTIETLAGIFEAWIKESGLENRHPHESGGLSQDSRLRGNDNNINITLDMGAPQFEWNKIPLAQQHDALHLPLSQGELSDPVVLSMGNPHAVFFVKDAQAVPLDIVGPKLEYNAIFPERANIGVAEIVSKEEINLRVWERGAGLTLACGTGACAALVAASRRNLTGRKATVHLPGGDLFIEWRESDNHVLMTGPAVISFRGSFVPEDYAA